MRDTEDRFQFPRGFLWGAATSAHQVEGGNRASDWWEYERSGRLPHASGDACGHYERFAEDFALAARLGHNAHRLSLEWSRIEPERGRFDGEALAHYRAVLTALRACGLEPVVTLHHFTNPAWFLRRGGWVRRGSAAEFARFVAHVARELGGGARWWITINEPSVYALHAYVLGLWPPLARSAWIRAALCQRHMARAHVLAYRVLREALPDARVGFAHGAPLVLPCDPARGRDRLAARLRDRGQNLAFLRAIDAPRNLDFLGLNYYTRTLVRAEGLGAGALLGRACKRAHHEDRGPVSQTGWEVHPAGLTRVLERFSSFGLPLLVTENGIATEDEQLRRRFLSQHLESLAEALRRGVDVVGYLYWSLLDTFEWERGAAPRYGLVAVDPRTQGREPRPCAADFARVCRENALSRSARANAGSEA